MLPELKWEVAEAASLAANRGPFRGLPRSAHLRHGALCYDETEASKALFRRPGRQHSLFF